MNLLLDTHIADNITPHHKPSPATIPPAAAPPHGADF